MDNVERKVSEGTLMVSSSSTRKTRGMTGAIFFPDRTADTNIPFVQLRGRIPKEYDNKRVQVESYSTPEGERRILSSESLEPVYVDLILPTHLTIETPKQERSNLAGIYVGQQDKYPGREYLV